MNSGYGVLSGTIILVGVICLVAPILELAGIYKAMEPGTGIIGMAVTAFFGITVVFVGVTLYVKRPRYPS